MAEFYGDKFPDEKMATLLFIFISFVSYIAGDKGDEYLMASVALLTITGMLSQAVGFAYRVRLTRLAGAEIMGLYQLILPVYSILLSLTSVGLTTGVSNLSAWYQALGDRRAILIFIKNQKLY